MVELRNAVASRFSLDLPATATFDYPTSAALAAYVHGQLPGAPSDSGEQEVGQQPVLGWGTTHTRRPRRQQHAQARHHAPQAALPAILEKLQEVVTGVLGVAPPTEQPLMEAGLDSLGAVELRNAIGSSFGLNLPATLTFDYPTLSALAAYIAEEATGESELLDSTEAWALLPRELGADVPMSASLSTLVAVSCRYPSANGGTASLADIPPPSPVAGVGNADLTGFADAVQGGANQPLPVPPQRWDIDRVYDTGKRSF